MYHVHQSRLALVIWREQSLRHDAGSAVHNVPVLMP